MIDTLTKPDRTCPICLQAAPEKRHPCQFAYGCSCWYGIPCGKPPHSTASPTPSRPAYESSPTYRRDMKEAGRHV